MPLGGGKRAESSRRCSRKHRNVVVSARHNLPRATLGVFGVSQHTRNEARPPTHGKKKSRRRTQQKPTVLDKRRVRQHRTRWNVEDRGRPPHTRSTEPALVAYHSCPGVHEKQETQQSRYTSNLKKTRYTWLTKRSGSLKAISNAEAKMKHSQHGSREPQQHSSDQSPSALPGKTQNQSLSLPSESPAPPRNLPLLPLPLSLPPPPPRLELPAAMLPEASSSRVRVPASSPLVTAPLRPPRDSTLPAEGLEEESCLSSSRPLNFTKVSNVCIFFFFGRSVAPESEERRAKSGGGGHEVVGAGAEGNGSLSRLDARRRRRRMSLSTKTVPPHSESLCRAGPRTRDCCITFG